MDSQIIRKVSSAIRQAHGPEWPVVKTHSHNRQSKGGVAFDRSSLRRIDNRTVHGAWYKV